MMWEEWMGEEKTSNQEKLEAAKAWLGEKWVLHVNYDSSKNPKHLKKSYEYVAGY